MSEFGLVEVGVGYYGWPKDGGGMDCARQSNKLHCSGTKTALQRKNVALQRTNVALQRKNVALQRKNVALQFCCNIFKMLHKNCNRSAHRRG
jgi:hypothetical protein